MKEVQAYISEEDGKMFTDRMEAIAHEVRLKLLRVFLEAGCNDALAQYLWQRSEEIAVITLPLAKELVKRNRKIIVDTGD